MRTPFVRPLLSVVFYVFAGLTFAGYLLLGLVFLLGSSVPLSAKAYAGAGASITMGIVVIIAGVMSGGILVAIGQFIELIAKIEWNTRPNTDDLGYVVPEPGSTPSPRASLSGKKYYLREKGQERGPFNGSEVLALYQAGKVSFATTIYVDEEGQRRPLKNISEINP